MIVRTSSRLPGLRFESLPPPTADVLPRMDVAMFVGFAASGPLNRPVPVEDVAQFTEIFGHDLPLVWDMQTGETIYAYLGPTVRSFFNNGGKRCWVVRVAGRSAQYNSFPLSGLARVDESGTISPAFARARSEGSWSDSLRVSTALTSRRIYANATALSPGALTLTLPASSVNDIANGDLLRLTFEEGYVLLLPVEQKPLTTLTGSAGHRKSTLTISYSHEFWFRQPVPLPETTPTQQQAQSNSTTASSTEEPSLHIVLYTAQGAQPPYVVSQFKVETDGTITCMLQVPFAQAPQPGMLVQIAGAAEPLWMVVQQVQERSGSETDAQQPSQAQTPQLLVQGQGLWYLQDAPTLKVSTQPVVETLSFALSTYTESGLPQTLSNLAFTQEQPYFWAALPTDQQLYEETFSAGNEYSILSQALANTPYSVLWNAAINPRFPLAGDDALSPTLTAMPTGAYTYLPIGMPATPDFLLECYPVPDAHQQPRLTRNGLDNFGAALFLDSDMVGFGVSDIIEQAELLHYGGPTTHHLQGIYNALGVDEISLIAVPDAIHRGWTQVREDEQQTAQSGTHTAQTPQLDGKRPSPEKGTEEARHSRLFHTYDPVKVESPELRVVVEPDIDCTFTLGWSPSELVNAKYRLEEARSANMQGAVLVYVGSGEQLTIFGRKEGDFYYRIRVEGRMKNGMRVTSSWSTTCNVCPSQAQHWQLKSTGEYDASDLLAVQRVLMRMCAARGDLFAVISLPEHYRVADAISHVAALKSPASLSINMPAGEVRLLSQLPQDVQPGASPATMEYPAEAVYTVLPFSSNEKAAYSYGALYHPWLYVLNEDLTVSSQPIPPDGGACGILAKRALARGAWIAPANEALSDTVALAAQVSRSQWKLLQDSQVNLILQERQGFLSLSADTLSEPIDVELRPINVRRLLSLLRRLMLGLGATYVFEPNSEAFQRSVQLGFEAMLQDMFMRGAFAGNTPATSYRVVADSSINTQQSMNQGCFIVAIQVAPSYPLKFLTIRLLQSGLGATVTEGVS